MNGGKLSSRKFPPFLPPSALPTALRIPAEAPELVEWASVRCLRVVPRHHGPRRGNALTWSAESRFRPRTSDIRRPTSALRPPTSDLWPLTSDSRPPTYPDPSSRGDSETQRKRTSDVRLLTSDFWFLASGFRPPPSRLTPLALRPLTCRSLNPPPIQAHAETQRRRENGLLSSDLRSPTSDLCPLTSGFRPRTSALRPRTSDIRRPISDVRHPTSDLNPTPASSCPL